MDLPLVTGPFTSVEQLQVRSYVELKRTESSIPRVEAHGHLAASSYRPCAAQGSAGQRGTLDSEPALRPYNAYAVQAKHTDRHAQRLDQL